MRDEDGTHNIDGKPCNTLRELHNVDGKIRNNERTLKRLQETLQQSAGTPQHRRKTAQQLTNIETFTVTPATIGKKITTSP